MPLSATASAPRAATSSSIVLASGDLLAMNSRAMFWLLGHVPRTASVNVILTLIFFIFAHSFFLDMLQPLFLPAVPA